jgi:hypothetical protein
MLGNLLAAVPSKAAKLQTSRHVRHVGDFVAKVVDDLGED